MIPKFKTYISEGVWGNISKRAEGNLERKEDDLNSLRMSGLLEYIQKRYVITKDDRIVTLQSTIGIPLFTHDYCVSYLWICYDNSLERIYYVYSRFLYDVKLKNYISSRLKQKYLVKAYKDRSSSKYDDRQFSVINVKPKDGDIDNKFVIDVIDTYIDIIDNLDNIDKHIMRK